MIGQKLWKIYNNKTKERKYMSLSISTRQAYTEIDTFINLLDEYNKNKIPQKLREYFKNNRDVNYSKEIKPNQPIKNQNLKE